MLTYRLHVECFAEVVLLPAHQPVSPGVEAASRSETGRVRQPWECLVESILVDFHHPIWFDYYETVLIIK